jgi:hypothetical protein
MFRACRDLAARGDARWCLTPTDLQQERQRIHHARYWRSR